MLLQAPGCGSSCDHYDSLCHGYKNVHGSGYLRPLAVGAPMTTMIACVMVIKMFMVLGISGL